MKMPLKRKSLAAEAGILHRIHNGEMYENSDILEDTQCLESELYYQPSFLGDKLPEDLYDHEVFSSKEKAERCFPGFEIMEFSGDDIEGKVFVDDDFEDEQD